jgi:hypothetical protein
MTGTNFSSWYNATEGTFYGQFIPGTPITNSANQYLSSASDGTLNNRVSTFRSLSSGDIAHRVTASGASQLSAVSFGAASQNGTFKSVIVYGGSGSRAATNGNLSTAGTNTAPNGVNRFYIGANEIGTSTQQINGHIQRIAYWGVRLDNSKLQALTT